MARATESHHGMKTYLLRGEEITGPYERQDIMEGLSTGTISPDDLCAREGWEQWKKVSDVYKSRPVSQSAPPALKPLKKPKKKTPSSNWRDDPITAKQKDFLKNNGKKPPKTKGEASDLIGVILGTHATPRQRAKLRFFGLLDTMSYDAAQDALDALENDPGSHARMKQWDRKKASLHPDLYNSDGSYRDEYSLQVSPGKKAKGFSWSGLFLILVLAALGLLLLVQWK